MDSEWAFPDSSGKKVFAIRVGPNPVLKAYPGWDIYNAVAEYKVCLQWGHYVF